MESSNVNNETVGYGLIFEENQEDWEATGAAGIGTETQEYFEIEDGSNQGIFHTENEYENDIYIFEREMELKYVLRENFLEQNLITPMERETILTYFIDFCEYMNLPHEVLHLAVSILDRFLEKTIITSSEYLNLIAITTLGIALKIEHRQNVLSSTKELVLFCGNQYSASLIVDMEKMICGVLEFNVIYPYSISFFRRFSRVARMSKLEYYLGLYLLEIGSFHYLICHIKPSLLAAAACCLSLSLFRNEIDLSIIWSYELEWDTFYSLTDLIPVISHLAFGLYVFGDAGTTSNLFNKYAKADNFMVSTFQQVRDPDILNQYFSF